MGIFRDWGIDPYRTFVRTGLAAALIALSFMASPGRAESADITIGGTGSALATMRILVDAFTESHQGVSSKVLPSLGSSGGIKAVLGGAIDLAVAARPPKDKERAAGAVGRRYGRTAFVLAVPQENPVTGLTSEELLEIFRGERTSWPNGTRLQLVLRPMHDSDSRLLAHFLDGSDDALETLRKNPAIPVAHTDQDAADQIETMPGGLGTATLALILSERRQLKALDLNGIRPSEATVADGSYPMTKSYYFVTTAAPNPLTVRFLEFVQSPQGQALLRQTGHVPATS